MPPGVVGQQFPSKPAQPGYLEQAASSVTSTLFIASDEFRGAPSPVFLTSPQQPRYTPSSVGQQTPFNDEHLAYLEAFQVNEERAERGVGDSLLRWTSHESCPELSSQSQIKFQKLTRGSLMSRCRTTISGPFRPNEDVDFHSTIAESYRSGGQYDQCCAVGIPC